MAGLVSDSLPRVISAQTHGIIDYIHVATNFTAAALFRRNGNVRASNCSLALGANVLLNALCTDYEVGVFRLWNFKVHGILDYGVAATSAAMPAMFGFHDTPEAAYFYGQGAGETAIAAITDYDDDSGARRHRRSNVREFETRAA
jgi:hypothetical protein